MICIVFIYPLTLSTFATPVAFVCFLACVPPRMAKWKDTCGWLMDKGYMLSEKEYLEVSRYGLPTTGWLGLHNIDVDLCEF